MRQADQGSQIGAYFRFRCSSLFELRRSVAGDPGDKALQDNLQAPSKLRQAVALVTLLPSADDAADARRQAVNTFVFAREPLPAPADAA
jgi:hypothetical protein